MPRPDIDCGSKPLRFALSDLAAYELTSVAEAEMLAHFAARLKVVPFPAGFVGGVTMQAFSRQLRRETFGPH